ncbi:MAG: hypothetical protein AUJ85_09350 [Elusimicrobia bacterium CG1_02_37_114]|nr:MAG: hypothetical protein AUJ85_09350 [Elusimicrobia bacterium CG1_02_37_114]PIV52742.1 MAG: metallophosphoesterase [Elusimicrobia bacterium CG02_land_8_20_14_3_00_37_13]PIZ12826.1 MAG: metallophosphoesterase [Elusimicrobia bacterium CG_4_10_14_0_8_um_filter_37_32]
MRLVCFSDIHADYGFSLPEGDVLIFAGDFSGYSTELDVIVFNNLLKNLNFKHKIIVAGNHELQIENNPYCLGLFTGCTYLQDKTIEIDGVKFYGSPWSLPFNNWAFNKSEDKLKIIFDNIPEGIDVLITHHPPYGILDYTPDGVHHGSISLLERIKMIKPKVHIFGNIHFCGGLKIEWCGIDFYNVSLLNEAYNLINKPTVIDIS